MTGAPTVEFSLSALYEALDERRRASGLTWQGALDEINRGPGQFRGIAVSTVTGLRTKRVAERDGVLGMLLVWPRGSPESFMAGHPLATALEATLPHVLPGHRGLRWDTHRLTEPHDLRNRWKRDPQQLMWRCRAHFRH